MKYANQVNIALVVAAVLLVVYTLSQTYCSMGEMRLPVPQEWFSDEVLPTGEAAPSLERWISGRSDPASDQGSPDLHGIDSSEPTLVPKVNESVPKVSSRGLPPAPRVSSRSQFVAPPGTSSRVPSSSGVRSGSGQTGRRPGQIRTRPPREILPGKKRQPSDDLPNPPVRSSLPNQGLPIR